MRTTLTSNGIGSGSRPATVTIPSGAPVPQYAARHSARLASRHPRPGLAQDHPCIHDQKTAVSPVQRAGLIMYRSATNVPYSARRSMRPIRLL